MMFIESVIFVGLFSLLFFGFIKLIKMAMNINNNRESKPATQEDLAMAVFIILLALSSRW